MKPGIVVVAMLDGPIVDQIDVVQRRVDPRMAAEVPPHVTLIGSSGMGPLPASSDVDRLRQAMTAAAADTAPMSLAFDPPMQFMQSRVVCLPLDPNGPLRALHERLITGVRAAGLSAEPARFTFTPHCTLNLYRELPPSTLREVLAWRAPGSVTVDRIAAYRATNASNTECIIELPLTGSDAR